MSIHQLLTTFKNDLEAEIKADSKKWLPNQEADTYLAENILDHVNYVLEWDPTGETAEDSHSPCEWIPEDES